MNSSYVFFSEAKLEFGI